MKPFAAAIAAGLLLTATLAPAEAGKIQGTPVGLDHDPGGNTVTSGITDSQGNVTFGGLPPGRYVVTIPDTSKLKAPAVFRITNVRANATAVSAPLTPGKSSGKAFVLDSGGRKLVVTIGPSGGAIVVNVSSIFDRWGNM